MRLSIVIVLGDKYMKIAQIYKITNIINNKIYIGFTTQSLTKRFLRHKLDAKRGSELYLHRAMIKYGFDNFKIQSIYTSEDTEDTLKNKENYFIGIFNSNDPDIGYNLTLGGDGLLGFKHKEKTKIKMSNSARGNKNSLGVKFTEERKLNISNRMKGKGNPNFGKKMSDEQKNKISRKLKGRLFSNETKKKISIAKKGHKQSYFGKIK